VRILDQLAIETNFAKRWEGNMKNTSPRVQQVK